MLSVPGTEVLVATERFLRAWTGNALFVDTGRPQGGKATIESGNQTSAAKGGTTLGAILAFSGVVLLLAVALVVKHGGGRTSGTPSKPQHGGAR